MSATIPPWHISPVDADDDKKISEIMVKKYEQTGEHQSKAGTIRRAVRLLWRLEVSGDGNQSL